MHRQLATLAIAVFVTAPAAAQTRGADRPADSAAIRAHIESIFQAFVDKDRAKLAATHGAEWRGFTPWSGHVIRGRDGYMNEATFPPGLPKTQGMIGYRIGDKAKNVAFVREMKARIDRIDQGGAQKGSLAKTGPDGRKTVILPFHDPAVMRQFPEVGGNDHVAKIA